MGAQAQSLTSAQKWVAQISEQTSHMTSQVFLQVNFHSCAQMQFLVWLLSALAMSQATPASALHSDAAPEFGHTIEGQIKLPQRMSTQKIWQPFFCCR